MARSRRRSRLTGRPLLKWGQVAFLPVVLLMLGTWTWMRSRAAPVVFDTRSQLPQHDRIQVYFNHNSHAEYLDPYRGHSRPGDNLEQKIIDQIAAARSSIDVAVQELRSPLIAQALRDRRRAGVTVRVILENTYARAWSDYSPGEVAALDARLQARYQENLMLIDHNRNGVISAQESAQYDALKILESANIRVIDDTEDGSEGSGLMHHKFVVVDQQTVVTTSANFTLSDLHGDLEIPLSQGNANSLVVLHSSEIAQAFRHEFDLLWGDGPGGLSNSQFGVNKPHRSVQTFAVGDAQVWLKFSPDSSAIPWAQTSNGVIHHHLTRSREQVNLALFVFSEQRLADQLAIAYQNGVAIKALIDRSFAFRPYSEGLDLLGVALPQDHAGASACQTEPQNRPWALPVNTMGTPKLNPGDLLHHKFGVIDQSLVIMGSHNWSDAANRLNDETVIAIAHPTVAAHYQQEFERLYTNSRLGLPVEIEQKWQAYRRECAGKISTSSAAEGPQPINLNTATIEELESLPGIGRKTAQAILEARQQQPFAALEDLDAVPGIGPKTIARLRDRVTW